jgi:hypothetical protein
VQSNNAEDEDNRQSHDNNGINLETGGLVSVQPWELSAHVLTQMRITKALGARNTLPSTADAAVDSIGLATHVLLIIRYAPSE